MVLSHLLYTFRYTYIIITHINQNYHSFQKFFICLIIFTAVNKPLTVAKKFSIIIVVKICLQARDTL